MNLSDLKCRKCGKNADEIREVTYLKRINKGELPSIWECAENCQLPVITPEVKAKIFRIIEAIK